MERYIKKQILKDLNEKMVFIAGPRQVGKTTLSKSIFSDYEYLNWDIDQGRSKILNKEFIKSKVWIFDEIHKYKNWRNYLKGLYDQFLDQQKIIVTGSTKLDVLRKGGDSLQGRYHFHRLMPLSCKELKISNQSDLETLYKLSGFPEPFLKGSQTACNRWSKSYRERIVRQEISSNEQFQDLATIEIMYNRMPELVGGLLSINGVAEDIQVDHKTVTKWIAALERLYAIFRIPPFGSPKIKALKKSQKVYFFDWNALSDEGSRFENFIAVHLLKWIYFEQDVKGRNIELCYYRDKFEREVDFVILENRKPILFVEAKLSDTDSTKGLKYLKGKFSQTRAVQVHFKGKKDFIDGNGIEHMPSLKFLNELD